MSTQPLANSQPDVPPPHYSIFRGPNGIRAGWRLLIFLAIVAAFYSVFAVVILFFVGGARLGGSTLTPAGLSFLEGTIFVFTAVPALIMARIEHRVWGRYGLPLRCALGRDFWTGSLIGFAAISTTLLCIFALHGFRLAGLAIHGRTIVTSVASWSAAFVVVGLAEEFSFRGYAQFTLTTGMGFWPAALLMSVVFGAAHAGNPGESVLGLISVVFFGLLFCLFLRRRGNLWWAVGFHAGWDWGQTFFYGVPDSGVAPYHNLLNSAFGGPRWLTGGTVGPEASVFTPLVLAVVAILFSRAYRENRYPWPADSAGR